VKLAGEEFILVDKVIFFVGIELFIIYF